MFNHTTEYIILKCHAVVERYNDSFRRGDLFVTPTKNGTERKIRFQNLISEMTYKHPIQNYLDLYEFYQQEPQTSRLVSYLEDTLVAMAGLKMPHWTQAGRHTLLMERLNVLNQFDAYMAEIKKISGIENTGDMMLVKTYYRFSKESIELLCADIIEEYDYACRANVLAKSLFNEPTLEGIQRKIRFLQIVSNIPDHRTTEIFLKLCEFCENEPKNSRLIRIIEKNLCAFAGLQMPHKYLDETALAEHKADLQNKFASYVEIIKAVDQQMNGRPPVETYRRLRAASA